jgi:hypothetical protein
MIYQFVIGVTLTVSLELFMRFVQSKLLPFVKNSSFDCELTISVIICMRFCYNEIIKRLFYHLTQYYIDGLDCYMVMRFILDLEPILYVL